MVLTPYERDRLRAKRKVDRLNAKDAAGVPLFADQLEPRDANAEYWRWRKVKALTADGGHVDLHHVDWNVDKWILRNVARQVMPPTEFDLADQHRWHGDDIRFWKNILLGKQRIVLRYWRHVYGCGTGTFQGREFVCEKRIDCGEAETWPPPGYVPPLTEAELEALIAIPPPVDHPGAVDPLGELP